MKKTLTVITLLAGAVSVYSQGPPYLQGSVSMADTPGGSFAIQVFLPQSPAASTVAVSYGGYTGYEEMGNTSNTNLSNPGSTIYANERVVTGYGCDAGLLAAPGLGDALSSLSFVPGSVVSTWFTYPWSDFAGFWNSDATAQIPGTTPGNGGSAAATLAVAVWANSGVNGSATTLAQAQADGYDWGVSNTGDVDDLGGSIPGGGNYPTPSLPDSIESFSLAVNVVPEPSAIALGVMSASAFLFRRRK
jgi:hypothetical protein